MVQISGSAVEGKHGVKPVQSLLAVQFVTQSQGLKALFEAYKFPKSVSRDDAVNLANFIADSNAVGAGATAPRVGFFFEDGRQLIVYGEAVFTVDDLIEHGYLSSSDANIFHYIVKYLRKAVAP